MHTPAAMPAFAKSALLSTGSASDFSRHRLTHGLAPFTCKGAPSDSYACQVGGLKHKRHRICEKVVCAQAQRGAGAAAAHNVRFLLGFTSPRLSRSGLTCRDGGCSSCRHCCCCAGRQALGRPRVCRGCPASPFVCKYLRNLAKSWQEVQKRAGAWCRTQTGRTSSR